MKKCEILNYKKSSVKILFIIITILGLTISLKAQKNKEVKIIFLSNHTITEVNFNEGQFDNYTLKLSNKIAKFINNESKGREIIIQVNIKKDSLPDFQISARPSYSDIEMNELKAVLTSVKPVKSKIVDFLFAFEIKVNNGCSCPDSAFLPEIHNPYLLDESGFISATLGQKGELLQKWSKDQVLPLLIAFAKQADNEFLGVRMLGSRFSNINLDSSIEVKQYTDRDAYYWRAMMEMQANNFLIISMKVFLHVASGEFDIAKRYADLLNLFKHDKTISDYFLDELLIRLDYFYKDLHESVSVGVKMFEQNDFDNAIHIYHTILLTYYASSWTHFELFRSTQSLNLQNDSTYQGYREAWLDTKELVYGYDPLFSLCISNGSAEEAYRASLRNEVLSLFQDNELLHEDFLRLADITLDLGEYVLAAHLYWLALTHFSEKDLGKRNILAYYLFALDKAGIGEIQSFFDVDFKKEFDEIAILRKLEMERSEAFKNYSPTE